MPSANLQDTAIAFLETDVRTAVNAEQSNLLVAGSVYTAREPVSDAARKANAFPVAVEITPAEERDRAIGIGVKERELAFDLRCLLRRKATSDGKTQLDQVDDIARAIVNRYDGATNHAISPTGATFVRASAQRTKFDETPRSGELARAVVRVTLIFTEALRSNA